MADAYGVVFNALTCLGGPPYRQDVRNEVQRSGLASSRLSIGAACLPACDFDGLRATVDFSSVRIDIEDAVAPVVRMVRGPLAADASHTGVEEVIFDVTDAGVGVLRVAAEARNHTTGEWREVASEPIGGRQSSCVTLNETAYPYEFASPQPCPLSLTGAKLSLDTSRLVDGTHDFRVVVIDAAGNRTAVIPSRRFHNGKRTQLRRSASRNPRCRSQSRASAASAQPARSPSAEGSSMPRALRSAGPRSPFEPVRTCPSHRLRPATGQCSKRS